MLVNFLRRVAVNGTCKKNKTNFLPPDVLQIGCMCMSLSEISRRKSFNIGTWFRKSWNWNCDIGLENRRLSHRVTRHAWERGPTDSTYNTS